MCDCIGKVREGLAERNLRLDVAFSIKGETFVKIETIPINGVKTFDLVATYCPFCGQKYAQVRPQEAEG